jgi:hypothetical protein
MSAYPNKPRHLTIEVLPIAEAPVRHGEDEIFGPCLLMSVDDGWTTGRWNGDGWFSSNDSLPLKPTHYALLPATVAAADRDPFALARSEPNG